MAFEIPQHGSMESISTQKASDIDMPARQWLQHLFGRSLSEEEEVTILVVSPHAAPDDRKSAFCRMDEVLDKSAANMQDVAVSNFDEAVDEAMDHIRKRAD